MDLGTKLKTIRTNSVPSLTQNDVANKLNVPIQTYARYENGYRNPKNSQIHEFAQFYGVASFLLDPDNWSYVPLNTKGDLIALLIELFKRDFIRLTITEEQVQVEVPSHLSTVFKKCTPNTIADKDIVEALTRWVDVYEVDYLPRRGRENDRVKRFVKDELDKVQIQLTLQYDQPLKEKHESHKEGGVV